MNPLFKDKVTKIEKLLKVILDNFFTNYSYPDANAKIDDLPFPHLILSLKKKTAETLVDLYINNEGGDINAVAKSLESFGVTVKNGQLIYPTLEYFKEPQTGYADSQMIDSWKFDQYKTALECCLYETETSAYAYAVKRLYVSLEIIDGTEKRMEFISEPDFRERFEKTTAEEDLYWVYECDKSVWDFDYAEHAHNDELIIEVENTIDIGKYLKKHPEENERLSMFVSDKQMFMEIYSSECAKTNKISDYIMVLEKVIDALENKEHYDIPNEAILVVLDAVYNRILKAAVVTTINLYTRKKDAPIKKAALKEVIRKEYSIGSDRWNNCMALYSDTLFKDEELIEIAKHIPKMREVVEIL